MRNEVGGVKVKGIKKRKWKEKYGRNVRKWKKTAFVNKERMVKRRRGEWGK